MKTAYCIDHEALEAIVSRKSLKTWTAHAPSVETCPGGVKKHLNHAPHEVTVSIPVGTTTFHVKTAAGCEMNVVGIVR